MSCKGERVRGEELLSENELLSWNILNSKDLTLKCVNARAMTQLRYVERNKNFETEFILN